MSANFWFAGAKVVNYFGLSKKNRLGGRFFGVESKDGQQSCSLELKD